MSKNSLSALDFVINVLREHEKELTELSDRLENTLTVVKGEDVRRSLDELNSSVQILARTIEGLSERIDSRMTADMRFSEIIDSLKEESQRQKERINDILTQLKALPTRDDLENLRRAIDTLSELLAKNNQKLTGVLKG